VTWDYYLHVQDLIENIMMVSRRLRHASDGELMNLKATAELLNQRVDRELCQRDLRRDNRP